MPREASIRRPQRQLRRPIELANWIVGSYAANECAGRQLFPFAMGREDMENEPYFALRCGDWVLARRALRSVGGDRLEPTASIGTRMRVCSCGGCHRTPGAQALRSNGVDPRGTPRSEAQRARTSRSQTPRGGTAAHEV